MRSACTTLLVSHAARGLLAAALPIACTATPADAQVEPVSPRAQAVVGLPLLIPVNPAGPNTATPAIVPLTLADGTKAEATLHAVAVRAHTDITCGPAVWLGPVADATEVTTPRPSEPALAWYLRVPPGIADGTQSVTIDSRRVRLEWSPAPAALAAEAGLDARLLAERSAAGELDAINDPWASPVPPAFREDPVLLELSRPALDDPAIRWRVALAIAGLHPIDTIADRPTPIRFGDAATIETTEPARTIVDDLADLERAKWQAALLQLWLADRGASLRARRALAGAIIFEPIDLLGSTTAAPVWLAGDQDAAALLALIDRSGDRASTLLERFAVWSAGLPDAFAYAVDDAGIAGPLGDDTAAPLLLAGSFSPQTVLAAASPSVGRPTPPIEVEPWTARLLEFDAGLLDQASPMITTAGVRVGEWTQRLRLRSGVLAARPPGVTLGPLIEDITLPLLLAEDETGSGLGRIPDARTIARLEHRVPDPMKGSEPQWLLYIECQQAPGEANENGDAVRIWIGPTGEPVARVRISPDGRATDETGRFRDEAFAVRATRGDDRWAATVTIPASAVPPTGVLRMGIERTEPCGRRTAWPRPLLPWQTEPGRLAIDTTAWRSLDSLGSP